MKNENIIFVIYVLTKLKKIKTRDDLKNNY